jgi:hypothetical protein
MSARLEYVENRLEAILRADKMGEWEPGSLNRTILSAGRDSSGDFGKERLRALESPTQSWPKGDREKERIWARNHIRRVSTPEWRF